ncbi:hypothetical protein [Microcoleus sp. S13_C5]|uniref:hypothetical protein n=1 Tax=Microcoleus sp. S13_C5 TaxID=3055411 RepID=UPI002FD4FB8C
MNSIANQELTQNRRYQIVLSSWEHIYFGDSAIIEGSILPSEFMPFFPLLIERSQV